MTYFELFQESPALFFLVIVISLVVTLLVYGAFPVIFSKTRKTPITKKKYKGLCYGINAIGLVFFVALNGASNGAPYLLWTWIFSNYGIKNLTARGLLSDTEKNIEEVSESADKILFCRKCGTILGIDSRFCRKCGTEIKEEKQ
jgi:ribosomal protein L40E